MVKFIKNLALLPCITSASAHHCNPLPLTSSLAFLCVPQNLLHYFYRSFSQFAQTIEPCQSVTPHAHSLFTPLANIVFLCCYQATVLLLHPLSFSPSPVQIAFDFTISLSDVVNYMLDNIMKYKRSFTTKKWNIIFVSQAKNIRLLIMT